MKKPTILIILSICLSTLLHSQKNEYSFECFKPINDGVYEKGKVYEVLVVSAVGCGYANKLLELLSSWNIPENVNITIAEFGDEETIKKMHSKYFNIFSFIKADNTKCFSDKFTPTLTLFKNNRKIWKCKGYKPKILSKLSKKVDIEGKS